MKKNIWKKLFIITSILLIIFITITMLFQSVFFGDFYKDQKVKMLQKNVEQFKSLYSNNYISNVSLSRMLRQFEENNNAKIVILNENGVYAFVGDTKPDSDNSKSSTISRVLYDWTSSPTKFKSILNTKITTTTTYNNPDYDIENIVCYSPFNFEGGKNIILAVSSLQPIEEASDVIREFYIYVFAGALIITLLLSLIYSNMISKPLIKLNRAAVRISEMDFSTQCDVNSEDEIGNLANTLNFLSQRLNTALNELRERNIQLERDIERERQLDGMRKDFIAGVSHELKTPISIISGYAEGLRDGIADEESKDFYLEVIMDESSKMSNLVSDMLDLSQLESGTFKLNEGVFQLDELLYKCIYKHKQFMNQKSIELTYEWPENIFAVGDIVRIEQVVTNFLTNAIRHTPDRGKIEVFATEETNRYMVCIENSGEKIAEKEMSNIWDKFYKIDKSRNRNVGGTGLGLSIVKNILMMHNSTFGVRNTEEGVRFFFTLSKPS
ncbi:MAG: HAMP domain-containing sensor histidine kinase [Bacillota bacterium]|nr:HAMP domain-containing sensor histidine kinase [Bacillota bacterium]